MLSRYHIDMEKEGFPDGVGRGVVSNLLPKSKPP